MNNRFYELVALSFLTMLIMVSMVVILYISPEGDAPGIAIGGLVAALTTAFQTIRSLHTSAAMQTMADQLGNSQPVVDQEKPQ